MVDCNYVERDMGGNTPKFACRLANGDEVKVKYGRDNGEVYAEVAASRLLWALGFSADAMYPVRVRCHGCPGRQAGGDARCSTRPPSNARSRAPASPMKGARAGRGPNSMRSRPAAP